MTDLQIMFQEDSFEDSAVKNGVNLWNEADLMQALGYLSADSFKRVIQKAQQACLSLGIAIEEIFIRQPDTTYRLTRFACYLIAINADSKKPEVAAAQVYFAALADTFRSAIEQAQDVDRVLIRDEVSAGETSLSSTANRHGVESFAFFHNAGYRGMYNMNLTALMTKKGVAKGERLIDRMGKDEIAAHLFRITQTDAKIKNEGLKGQQSLESAAEKVGKHVRQSMIELSGQRPENLPVADPIKDVKKRLKTTNKQFKKLDSKTPKPKNIIDSTQPKDSEAE